MGQPSPEPSQPDPSDHPCESDLTQHTFHLKDLPQNERPRTRLLHNSPRDLSTGELLAILLGTGNSHSNLSALDLGQHILQRLSADHLDHLTRLRDITPQELMQISGIGPAKAATIVAAIELGKRAFHHPPQDQPRIEDPGTAAAILTQDLMWQPQERFAVLLLNVKHRLINRQVLTIGTATETLAHPREIFRDAIRQGATRLILAHNHPSGDIEASPEDIKLTRQLLQCAQFLNIPILDHLILGNGDYSSMRQTTNLWELFPEMEIENVADQSQRND